MMRGVGYCCLALMVLAVASAQHGHQTMADSIGAPRSSSKAGMASGGSQSLADAAGAAPPAPPAVVEKGGFSGMYFGILVGFGIIWTIYYFIYFFEYESAGDANFFFSSYVILFVLISLGLSQYFTASILTALLVACLFITIAASGFGAMLSISSPDRFEGDKSNMGRTRLE